jgi:hypothetical protein
MSRKGIARISKLRPADAELGEERDRNRNFRHRRKRFLCSSEHLRF